MPRKQNNNFPIGTYAKKKRAILEELCEEKVNALSEIKLQQQNIRRLKEKVENEARARVREAAGDASNTEWVLSKCSLQFGIYRGKTFIWLLSNDWGWAVMVLASHKTKRAIKHPQGDSQWDNKEALRRIMPPKPRFRRNDRGEVILQQIRAAAKDKQRNKDAAKPTSGKHPHEVRKEAIEAVNRRNGDVNDEIDVKGEYEVQFGHYHGQTFRWLLETKTKEMFSLWDEMVVRLDIWHFMRRICILVIPVQCLGSKTIIFLSAHMQKRRGQFLKNYARKKSMHFRR
ncbi:uncharacterized protein LOC5509576 [Nematostella vectensis]|uniref:uncharacterized protein LOC5509576 n=1 Tax=Nematostella vectensis TaxID=45351 RepID=UPI002076FD36|nr:uncharacterized protein LOC5509576 [Nematostella vectensis]